jgi:hypothetical protein
VLLFNYDIVHQSWHEKDTYRRVIHLSWSHGDKRPAGQPSKCPAAFDAAPEGSWLRYLLRPSDTALTEEAQQAKL